MKTAVITGATSGIGFAAAQALLAQGWRVIGIGHRPARCREAKEKLLCILPGAEIAYLCYDCSNQTEVRLAAEEIQALLSREGAGLNALILNAGCVRSYYTTSAQGYEMQLALNYLSGVLLTHLLLPQLKQAQGRVLWTGSGSHKNTRIRWDDVMLQKRYTPLAAYKRSKLCLLLFAQAFNRNLADTGVRMYVVDPGLVDTEIGLKETGGLVKLVWSLRRRHGTSAEVPAQTFAYLCSHAPAPDGLYYYHCAPAPYSGYADDPKNCARMLELSERLCGVRFAKEACV